MTLPKPSVSYDDYLKLPDDQRCEVVEGALAMTPAPDTDHQLILLDLGSLLRAFTRREGLGTVLAAPTDVILSDHNIVQPDLLFVSRERLSIVQKRGVFGVPDLVVEILSPSTATRDLGTKRELYSRFEVREYWIVDPVSRSVEVLTQQGAGLETWQRFADGGTLESSLLPGLTVNLSEIFPG